MARLTLDDEKTVKIPKTVTVKKTIPKTVTQPVAQPTQPVATSDAGIADVAWKPVAQPTVPIQQPIQQFVPQGPSLAQMQAALRAEQERARIAGLERARQASLSALGAEQAEIAPAYAGARSQTRAVSERGAQQFAQFLASRGLTQAGGAALGETRRLGAQQAALGGLQEQETAALGDIARRRSDIQAGFASDVEAARAGIQAQSLQDAIAQARLDETARVSAQQREFENAIKMAGLTGQIDGQQTLLGQQFADSQAKVQQDLELGRIGIQEAQLRLQQLQTPAPVTPTRTGGTAEVPGTGITYDTFDKISDLYKSNPELARSYVQTLNLPNYQFNQIMASLQEQPEAPRPVTTTAYKTSPDYAEDLSQIINATPEQKTALLQQLRANAQAFITKYGVDGYQALLAEAQAF